MNQGRHFLMWLCATAILAVFLSILTPFASAQPVPNITSASTDVLVVGKTTDITLNGDFIGDGNRILVVGESGVTLDFPKPATQPSTKPTTKPAEAVKINPKELKVRATV